MTHNKFESESARGVPKWLRWTLVAAVSMIVLLLGGWLLINRYVKSDIQRQLAELSIGDVTIGNASVVFGGVQLKDIEFSHGSGDEKPWLSVDELKIEHSVAALAAGANHYDAIEVSGVHLQLKLDDLLSQQSGTSFSLKDVDVPADIVRFAEIDVALEGAGSRKIEALGIRGKLESADGLKTEGSIEDLAGGSWSFTGFAKSDDQTGLLNLESDSVALKTEHWSAWPLILNSFNDVVTVDGTVSANVQISLASGNRVDGQGQVEVQNLQVNLPQFDLPLNATAGLIRFRNEQLEYSGIDVTTAEGGQIIGSGATGVSEFPIKSGFSGQYREVAIETWRHLVPDVPAILSGNTSGQFDATLAIEESLRASVAVFSEADVTEVQYGQLSTNELTADVKVDALVFDDQQAFESVTGSAKATGSFVDQPAADLLSTFELNDLQEQLQISGKGSGQLTLMLPLSTVAELETWELDVDANVPEGEIAGQFFRQARIPVKLRDGILAMDGVQVTTVESAELVVLNPTEPEQEKDELLLTINWPLTENTAMQGRGKIDAVGKEVNARWLAGFLNHQTAVASGRSPKQANKAVETINGIANFKLGIEIPTSDPADLSGWLVKGALFESELGFDDVSLQRLKSDLKLENSILQIENLEGRFSERHTISSSGQIDINDPSSYSVRTNAQGMPLSWAINLIDAVQKSDLIPALKENDDLTARMNRLENAINESKVQGVFDLDVDISNRSNAGPANTQTWHADASLKSDSLSIGDAQLSQVIVDISSDLSDLHVKQISLNVDNGSLDGSGHWNIERQSAVGSLNWEDVPVSWLADLANMDGPQVVGASSGSIDLKSADAGELVNSNLPLNVSGKLGFTDVSIDRLTLHPFQLEIATEKDQLVVRNLKSPSGELGIRTTAVCSLSPPYNFEVVGDMEGTQLSNVFRRSSVIDQNSNTVGLTGTLNGNFQAVGQVQDFDFRTNGLIEMSRPTINLKRIGDFKLDWDHVGNDWKQSSLVVHAFGGTVEMKELSSNPQRVRLQMDGIDSEQVSATIDLPVEVSGKLDGEASLNDWSLSETRWFDVKLSGSSVAFKNSEFGDFRASAMLKSNDLKYEVSGSFLSGKVEGSGETTIDENSLSTTEFPFELNVKNASLKSLHGRSNQFRSLRPLSGRLAGTATFLIDMNGKVDGEGRISLDDVKWAQNLVTREASVRVKIDNDKIVFDDVKADLKRGTIAAKANIPLTGELGGTYEVNVNHLDLERLTKVFGLEELEAAGLVDVRVGGMVGRQVTGRGYVGVDRASLHGVTGQSLRLPIQYQFSPSNQSGRIELRRSKFRLFDGKVSGAGRIEFGRRLDISTDLELTNVNTGDLIEAAADFHDFDQGKLSGKVKLTGKGVRSARDLKGSFKGKLSRADAFQLPVLSDIGRVISRQNIANNEFDSDEILLALNRGRIEVKNLNFQNSLAQIAITGSAYVDGRLDLRVAGRVEQLDQPTLIDELLGSPLVNFGGTPTAFAAQAAEFLSNRVVFLRVGGTIERPQVRVDSPQQLREETIRYFLRDSKILPFGIQRNN